MTMLIRAALAASVALGLSNSVISAMGAIPSETSLTPVKVYQSGGDVKAPELLASNVATPDAAGCEGLAAGKVVLSAIVDSSGRARNLMFLRPLGNALDKLALTLLAAERFKPGEKDGQPVAVGVSVEMNLKGCIKVAGDEANKDLKRLVLQSQPELTLGKCSDCPNEAVFTETVPSSSAKVFRVAKGVTPPVALVALEAQLADAAKKAKYQGQVMVTVLVDEQGMPQNPRVVRPLGMGLDQKALDTIVLYRFKPAMLNGQRPVPVVITVGIDFRLY